MIVDILKKALELMLHQLHLLAHVQDYLYPGQVDAQVARQV
jgi:hypothetical protein